MVSDLRVKKLKEQLGKTNYVSTKLLNSRIHIYIFILNKYSILEQTAILHRIHGAKEFKHSFQKESGLYT